MSTTEKKAKTACGRRYRIWLVAEMKQSGTRHCTKRRGHKSKCGGKAKPRRAANQ